MDGTYVVSQLTPLIQWDNIQDMPELCTDIQYCINFNIRPGSFPYM